MLNISNLRQLMLAIWLLPLLVLPKLLTAQVGDSTLFTNPHEVLAEVYSELDSTLIPFGMLEDQAVRYISPSSFRGDLAYHDSVAIDINGYGRMLFQALAMAVSPDTAYQFFRTGYMQDQHLQDDTIRLAALFARTSEIAPNILLDSLMTIDTIAGRFYDVLPRSQSPYLERRIAAFAPHTSVAPGQAFAVTLPQNNLATNARNLIFELDAGDGQGWQVISTTTPISVNYTQDGTYPWTLRITEGNHSYLAHSSITVEPPQRPALMNGGRFCSVHAFQGGSITFAFAERQNGCVDTTVRNPIIIVDPFDPFNETGLDEVFNRIAFFDQTRFQTGPYAQQMLINIIDDRSLDIIYIDYADGGAPVFENGAFVAAALENIMARLDADNVTVRPNVVGLSMGGLTSIIGINLLEDPNQDGLATEDSGVNRLFTFDSPLRGANVPINLQLAAQLAISAEVRGGRYVLPFNAGVIDLNISALDVEPQLALADAALNSPAAWDLLYLHAFAGGGALVSPTFIGYTDQAYRTFSSRFRALNITVPIFAMSDGDDAALQNIVGQGSTPTVLPAGPMIGLQRRDGDGLQIDLNVDYLPANFFFRVRQRIQFNLPWGLQFQWTINLAEADIDNGGIPNYDVSPGGTETLGLDQMIVGITAGIGFQIDPLVGSSYFSFVPTRSALDLDFTPGISDIPGSPILPSRANFTVTTTGELRDQHPALIPRANGVTLAPFPQEVFNHRHVSFTDAIGTFFVRNALPLPGLPAGIAGSPSVIGTKYNPLHG